MPTRLLKDTICTSDTIAQLTDFQECLFYRLIVTADDYGRYDARPAILKGKIYPLKDVRNEQISAALNALALAGLVVLYTVDGRPFVQLSSWAVHQRPPRCVAKFPAPADICGQLQTSADSCPQPAADCGVYPVSSNQYPVTSIQQPESVCVGDKPPARPRFTAPTVEDVAAYCKERGNAVDAQRFVDYYSSNGWKVGKNPMKDWRATVRNWERGQGATGNTGPGKPAFTGKRVTEQQYTQRVYDPIDLGKWAEKMIGEVEP